MYRASYCTKCGTKVEGDANYCIRCGNPLFKISVGIVEQEYDHNETEEEISQNIIDDLGLDTSLFSYKKPCEDYSTITYKDVDLFRIKYTSKARWIKILMNTEMRKEYIDNSLFDAQKNKNQVFWKSNITSIFDYKEIILKAIDNIDNMA